MLLVTRVSVTKLIGCGAAVHALQFSSVQFVCCERGFMLWRGDNVSGFWRPTSERDSSAVSRDRLAIAHVFSFVVGLFQRNRVQNDRVV